MPHIPEKYRNSVIFGSIHGCSIKQNILRPNGSTFTASRGDDFLVSGDKNFRPINLRWGPNGEIYVIDWHDQNPCSQAAPDSWDYEHGRVFRIQVKGTSTKKPENFLDLPTERLMDVLVKDDNPWRNRTALRILSERLASPHAPDGFYFKSKSKGLPHGEALRLSFLQNIMGHPTGISNPDPVIRRWNVRNSVPIDLEAGSNLPELARAARNEDQPAVRREIASSDPEDRSKDLILFRFCTP